MQIKAVIIDDEQIAREVLQSYLKKYCPQVKVLGEAQNIKEAVPLLENTQPQLVFFLTSALFYNMRIYLS